MRQRALCFSSTLLLLISIIALGMANPAYAQSVGCEDERAFGLKIKKIVKARNLKKLHLRTHEYQNARVSIIWRRLSVH
jgi:hypothetical protein